MLGRRGVSLAAKRVVARLRKSVRTYGYPMIIVVGIASAQVTLLFRGEQISNAIAAGLVWMAAVVLLSDFQEDEPIAGAAVRPRWQGRAALVALSWCLLVLTFSARFYDPLLLLVPLAACLAMALLDRTATRRTLRDLVVVGLLLPLQHVLVAGLPTGQIVTFTAWLSCLGLRGIGNECFSYQNTIEMVNQRILIDPPCAGIATLGLALTSSLVFLVLLPLRRRWFVVVALIGASLAIAFLVNAVRVMVLALSSRECDAQWWTKYCGFEFWHLGAGSHLFSLLAVGGVCLLWWWDIERHERAAAQ